MKDDHFVLDREMYRRGDLNAHWGPKNDQVRSLSTLLRCGIDEARETPLHYIWMLLMGWLALQAMTTVRHMIGWGTNVGIIVGTAK